MFRVSHLIFIYALAVIPLILILFILMRIWRKKALNTFGNSSVLTQLTPLVSGGLPIFKFVLIALSFFFLVIAIVDPQIGSKVEKVKRKGVDLVICLDVSNSMLAEDIKPNRLERAKQAISKLVDKLESDRIGLVVFAGKAFVQLPITTDFSAAKLFLSTISTDIISEQGTAIGAAIEQAVSTFPKDNVRKNKAIIIITDGENHEDDAPTAAKNAVDSGIVVHTLGMGLPEGAPIPVKRGYTIDYKKDNSGNTVITKLNEQMLQQIAAVGGGSYIRANNTEVGLEALFEEISKMQKKEIDDKTFSDYEDRFQLFLGIAIFLLIVEVLIYEGKYKFMNTIDLFEKKKK